MRRSPLALLVATAALLALTSCQPRGGAAGPAAPPGVGATPAPCPSPAVGGRATAAPVGSPAVALPGTFKDGTKYDMWVIAVHPCKSLTVRLAKHYDLDAAKQYLLSHGATVPPEEHWIGYVDVDLGKEYTVTVSEAATFELGSDDLAPFTWTGFWQRIQGSLSKPIAPTDRATYPGAAPYLGTILEVTFTGGIATTVRQISED
jgi:hypothetical protein